MKMFYVFWASGSLAEIKEFLGEDEMLECVRQHVIQYERTPVVYYGRKLEFEPAEIIKSWKIKASAAT